MLMMVAMVMAMAKIFAFRFYISKLPINRLRGRYVILPARGVKKRCWKTNRWAPEFHDEVGPSVNILPAGGMK